MSDKDSEALTFAEYEIESEVDHVIHRAECDQINNGKNTKNGSLATGLGKSWFRVFEGNGAYGRKRSRDRLGDGNATYLVKSPVLMV